MGSSQAAAADSWRTISDPAIVDLIVLVLDTGPIHEDDVRIWLAHRGVQTGHIGNTYTLNPESLNL